MTTATRAAPIPQEINESVKPQATLNIGPTGAGKTASLLTYAKAGIKTFIVSTEATGVESIVDSMRRLKVDPALVHWCHVRPTSMDIAAMIRSADQLNRKSVSDMQKIDSPAVLEKAKYRTFIKFLETIQNFKCDRTGEEFGDVTEWGDDKAFCVDSLTGVNLMTTQLQTGNRGTLTLPDYNVCQLTLENLIVTLCSANCFFAMNAHIEWETDEITGKRKVMASTVGKKLAPKIPIHFSEVFRSRREVDGKWWWSTVDDEAELKARCLPYSDKISQDYGLVVMEYHKRKALAEESKKPQAA